VKRPQLEATPQERLDAIGERGDDLVVVLGPDGCLRECSASVLRLLGYTPGELVGRAYAELLHPEDLATAGPAIRDGTDGTVRARVRHKLGHYVTLEASANAIRDESTDDVIEVVGVQRQSKQPADASTASATRPRSDEARENLLAVLAAAVEHIRTLSGDEELPDHVDEIVRNVEEHTTNRRSSGTGRSVSPQNVLQEIGPLLRGTLPEHIDVRIDFARHASSVPLHAEELRQIVTNLAKNAAEAMPHGGILSIVLAQAREQVTIEIEDSGEGMSSITCARAPHPFYTTKSSHEGLGLWVVQRLARQVGGSLQIDSELGRGTKVTVALPSATAPEHVGAPLGANLGRVLVVDDDPAMRTLVSRALTKLGYGVTQACDGDEALELIQRDDKFDLLITDVVMPSMGGLDLVSQIRERVPVPAIYMTGYQDLVLDERPDLAPLVLAKPFTARDLINTVRTVLKSSAP
jgi:PAS domain S-box-containing protein